MEKRNEKTPRKVYRPPSLKVYGNIRDLTLGVLNPTRNDGTGGGKSYSK